MTKFVLLIPLVIALSPVVIILMFFLGQWGLAVAFSLLIYFVNSWSECYTWNFLKRKSTKTEDTFRVLSYNLNRAYPGVNGDDSLKLLPFIKQKNPDIILLQEYNPLLYPCLDRELRSLYSYGSSFTEKERFKVVYSRYPIEEYRQLQESNHFLPICVIRFHINGQSVTAVNCHLHSNNYSKAWRIFKDNKNVFGFLSNVKKYLDEGYKIRTTQALRLRNEINSITHPLIICGDFNDISGSETVRLIKGKSLKDAWWERGRGMGFTFRSLGLRLRLDHILYNNKLALHKVEVSKADYSDHLPLISDLSIIKTS